ncbi:MAG: indole-3-glycerol phosphate synthase TrpC [Bacteroidales bacterium]|nr:indole-3-glycerol phosphate synthase TrpC [Bacteroidales bacterium]
MTILEEIIATKRREIERRRGHRPMDNILREAEDKGRRIFSMVDSLKAPGSTAIIAEFKTRSPSKGIINNSADVELVTRKYIDAGAAALSVLTDTEFFGGSFDDLGKARSANRSPILQKDFIIDEYQIAEALLYGADVILLIAAALDHEKVKSLSREAKEYGLEVILEIHKKDELSMLTGDIDIIGINNRNLDTFLTDFRTSLSLAEHIPGELVKISESGIYDADTIFELREAGFNGFLLGEAFMKEADPGEACRRLIEQVKRT